MAHVAQFVSAVTGACLVVEKRKFAAVGGFEMKKSSRSRTMTLTSA